MPKKNNSRKRINFDIRMQIQALIGMNKSISFIANTLGFNKSTISREIQKGLYETDPNNKEVCLKRITLLCCNNCKSRYMCNYSKLYYNCKMSESKSYQRMRVSRQIPKLSEESIKIIDEIILDGVKKGQSLHHIYVANPILNKLCCERTIRRLCYGRHLTIQPHNLRKYVVYKHKYIKSPEAIKLRNQANIVGRTYTDSLVFIDKHKKASIVQFDSVIGCKTDKQALLTITFKEFDFQFGYLIKKDDPNDVVKVIKNLFKSLTVEEIQKAFKVCISDNGIEFARFYEIEEDTEKKLHLCNVFYTRPYRSTDKAECERCHEFVRYFIPKGKSLDGFNQEQINYMFSQINSYVRKAKNDLSPYDMLCKKFGKAFAEKLPVKRVNKTKVTMKF